MLTYNCSNTVSTQFFPYFLYRITFIYPFMKYNYGLRFLEFHFFGSKSCTVSLSFITNMSLIFIKKLKHPSTPVILKWPMVNEKQLCTPVISSNGKITVFLVSFPWNSKSVDENWSWNRTFWMRSKIFLLYSGSSSVTFFWR